MPYYSKSEIIKALDETLNTNDVIFEKKKKGWWYPEIEEPLDDLMFSSGVTAGCVTFLHHLGVINESTAKAIYLSRMADKYDAAEKADKEFWEKWEMDAGLYGR